MAETKPVKEAKKDGKKKDQNKEDDLVFFIVDYRVSKIVN